METSGMVSQLTFSRKWTENQRRIIRETDTPETIAEGLASSLRGVKYALGELRSYVVEDCENSGAGFPEYSVGDNAYLVELYSDDPEQIAKAKRIRLACRRAVAKCNQCIFVREALPLARELTEGVVLPPRHPNAVNPPNPYPID